MFLSGSCPVRIALSGRQQKTSQNPTLVAQQSISNFILVMLSRVKSPWFIYILFYQHDSGLCSVCAQTYLILLEMAMIIIMNDNKDDNADLMRVLCAHTFSWWWWTALCLGFTKHLSQHKCCTQYMAYRAHTYTMYKGFQKYFTHHMFAQCAHSRQLHSALCSQVHTVAQHREQENYFHTIHLISISLQADALSFVNQFKQFWQNYCVSIMILQVGNNLKNRRKCVHH